MRIIAGAFKGRPISAPPGRGTRPTTDRDREALFSALSHQLEQDFTGRRVLDLFAGSGALGLEALSRGADHITFVEKDGRAASTITSNIEALDAAKQTTLLKRDALKMPALTQPVHLVFLDPPYGQGLIAAALIWLQANASLSQDALVFAEMSKTDAQELDVPELDLVWNRSRGESAMRLWRKR